MILDDASEPLDRLHCSCVGVQVATVSNSVIFSITHPGVPSNDVSLSMLLI